MDRYRRLKMAKPFLIWLSISITGMAIIFGGLTYSYLTYNDVEKTIVYSQGVREFRVEKPIYIFQGILIKNVSFNGSFDASELFGDGWSLSQASSNLLRINNVFHVLDGGVGYIIFYKEVEDAVIEEGEVFSFIGELIYTYEVDMLENLDTVRYISFYSGLAITFFGNIAAIYIYSFFNKEE